MTPLNLAAAGIVNNEKVHNVSDKKHIISNETLHSTTSPLNIKSNYPIVSDRKSTIKRKRTISDILPFQTPNVKVKYNISNSIEQRNGKHANVLFGKLSSPVPLPSPWGYKHQGTDAFFFSPSIALKTQNGTKTAYHELSICRALPDYGGFVKLVQWSKDKSNEEMTLYLEKGECTLFEFSKRFKRRLPTHVLRCIIFQVLYSLWYGQTTCEFMHNDLHLNNILLKKVSHKCVFTMPLHQSSLLQSNPEMNTTLSTNRSSLKLNPLNSSKNTSQSIQNEVLQEIDAKINENFKNISKEKEINNSKFNDKLNSHSPGPNNHKQVTRTSNRHQDIKELKYQQADNSSKNYSQDPKRNSSSSPQTHIKWKTDISYMAKLADFGSSRLTLPNGDVLFLPPHSSVFLPNADIEKLATELRTIYLVKEADPLDRKKFSDLKKQMNRIGIEIHELLRHTFFEPLRCDTQDDENSETFLEFGLDASPVRNLQRRIEDSPSAILKRPKRRRI